MLKKRKKVQNRYGPKTPEVGRRLVIKSQPVNCVEKLPPRQLKMYKNFDKTFDQNHRDYYDTDSKTNIPNADIYIDMEKDMDENCVTTVRRTCSKIKWPKTQKKSRYHKKCNTTTQQEPVKKCRKVKRNKTIASESKSSLGCEREKKEKYQNECYCRFAENNECEEVPLVKPVLISEEQKEKNTKEYRCNKKIKEEVKKIDYDPQSEFLNRLKKGMKKAFNCTCSSCMLTKLEKSLKYTNRRALIEGAYSEATEPSLRAKYYFPETPKCTNCKGKICDCHVEKAKKIRDENFFETHNTDNLHTTLKNLKINHQPHKCVHKYELDERLLPKPKNPDVYGQSRCEMCNKTMKSKLTMARPRTAMPETKRYSDKELQFPSKWSLSDGSNGQSCSTFNKSMINDLKDEISKLDEKFMSFRDGSPKRAKGGCNKCNLKSVHYCNYKVNPKQQIRLSSGCTNVNYPNNDAILELDLQSLDDKGLSSKIFFERMKKVNIKPNFSPYNSLALRYQRGVF